MLETTHDYFLQEHRAFMEALGSRSFWNLAPEQRDGALSGLLHAYTGCTDRAPEQERIREMAMGLAMEDYNRRSVLVAMHPRPEEAR
jgi:hypothetical protein